MASILKNKAYLERVIVVSGENWHNGILGIVAARICERFGKPTVVISSDGKMAKGSARSVDGFDLFAALSACSDLLTQVGGHKLAAGLTIETEKIDVFSKRINEYALKASSAPVPLLAD